MLKCKCTLELFSDEIFTLESLCGIISKFCCDLLISVALNAFSALDLRRACLLQAVWHQTLILYQKKKINPQIWHFQAW